MPLSLRQTPRVTGPSKDSTVRFVAEEFRRAIHFAGSRMRGIRHQQHSNDITSSRLEPLSAGRVAQEHWSTVEI